MNDGKKRLVLLSGGQDSTTCLYWAIRESGDPSLVRALTIVYGQRHAVETDCAGSVAGLAGVRCEHLRLPPGTLASTSPLIDHDAPVEQYESASKLPGGIEATFVPMRNLLFLTLAANRAIAHGFDRVVTGVSEEDFGGYPDCRMTFIRSAGEAIWYASGCPVGGPKIDVPLIDKTKRETVELAVELPGCMDALAHSLTCYNGQSPPCGKCHACLLRAKGFEEAGVGDPILVGKGQA